MTKLHGRRRIWLTVREFANATGDSPDTVRHRCQRGAYTCKRVGQRWRVSARHLPGES